MTMFWGFGLAVLYGLKVILQILAPAHVLHLTVIASAIIMPLFLIYGTKMWGRRQTREIRSGEPMLCLRCAQERLRDDVAVINEMPISDEEKAIRVAARLDLFTQECEAIQGDLWKDYLFARSRVTGPQAGFDPRGGTFDTLAKLKSKSEGYSVVLYSLGSNEDATIKALREVSGLAYQEARGLLSHLPAIIRSSVPHHEARAVFEALNGTGASVNIIRHAGN